MGGGGGGVLGRRAARSVYGWMCVFAQEDDDSWEEVKHLGVSAEDSAYNVVVRRTRGGRGGRLQRRGEAATAANGEGGERWGRGGSGRKSIGGGGFGAGRRRRAAVERLAALAKLGALCDPAAECACACVRACLCECVRACACVRVAGGQVHYVILGHVGFITCSSHLRRVIRVTPAHTQIRPQDHEN